MGRSSALREFNSSLLVVKELLKIEQRFQGSHLFTRIRAVQGLRGGAAILMVAAFEYFLRQLMEEALLTLSSGRFKGTLGKLPDKVRVNSIFGSLQRSMNSPVHGASGDRIDRVPEVVAACQLVVDGTLNSRAFSDTRSNPNSSQIRDMCNAVELKDIFGVIQSRFQREWGSNIALNFTRDKIDEIVNRRNAVAHTAVASNISSHDLIEDVRFLRTLARVLDVEIRMHVRILIKACR